MNSSATGDLLKQEIARLWQQREELKGSLEERMTSTARRKQLQQLITIDEELSHLDTRYKQIWDAQHQSREQKGEADDTGNF
ncbi:MAG: hypothetical protein HQL48_09785 [Gammaproteobacteria bacterium]|nr:hypothetical protein [Gammaproteobacteria bacterium]